VVDEKSESKAKVLSLLHLRTLKLEDSVLCVKLSPNGKFVAVALLDSTVKIFFVDTFKVCMFKIFLITSQEICFRILHVTNT
jgi:U3 small nucleolar RNA-associated protein 12